jgi:ATPase subunit of ABC transporter with duplicated ATPase domains
MFGSQARGDAAKDSDIDLLVTHDRYLVDVVATQIWEIDTDESHLIIFKGTYSQMKEQRENELAR